MLTNTPGPMMRTIALLACSLALASACAADAPEARTGTEDYLVLDDPYSPDDGRTVRLHDLVIQQPDALMALVAAETATLGPPARDERGEFVTILSSGAGAASFESLGFSAHGHRHRIPRHPGLSPKTYPPLAAACTWPSASRTYPRYDDPGSDPYSQPETNHRGIRNEILALAAMPGVRVAPIGLTHEQREILAVEFTTAHPGRARVVLVGAIHGNEWLATELALRLMRRAFKSLNPWSPLYPEEPGSTALADALGSASLIIVPVPNPDGYEFSRTVLREHRKNRRPTCGSPNSSGVDINRNFPNDWGVVSDDSMSAITNPCQNVFRGYADASGVAPVVEPETEALVELMRGAHFPETDSAAASIHYHTFGNYLVYPDGFKRTTNPDGPSCALNGNCVHPDYFVNMHVFDGNEHRTLLDPNWTPTEYLPWGSGRMVSGALAGTAKGHAASDVWASPHVSTTVELARSSVNECILDAVGPRAMTDAEVDGYVSPYLYVHETMLRRALSEGPAMRDSMVQFGAIGPAFYAREATDGFTTQSARPKLVAARNVLYDAGGALPFHVEHNGVSIVAPHLRIGGYYNQFGVGVNMLTGDSLRLPCGVFVPEYDTHLLLGQAECGAESQSVSMCDGTRLDAPGWALVTGIRGGASDCWWEAVGDGDHMLEIPTTFPAFGGRVTHCYTQFTSEATRPFDVEVRSGGDPWTRIASWPHAQPAADGRNNDAGARTFIYENNVTVGSGQLTRFRIVSAAGAPGPNSFTRVFDPITVCRAGRLGIW